jgi:hypothetical protein
MAYYNSGILYASPGSDFEATFDSVYTGGESGPPNFRISIIDTPTGDYYLEPTSEGIYEKPEGSGIYAWAGVSPSTTGRYTIYWDDGGDPAEVYAVEDFIVTGQPLLWVAGESQSQNMLLDVLPDGTKHIVDMKNVGPPSTPQEIKRQRRQTGDMLRRYGQPIVHRHMYTLDDVDNGIAKRCPACFDDAYSQVRNDCPVCHSVGFVSVENSEDRFIDNNGDYTYEKTSVIAPRFGGFAAPTLTLIMQPDVPIDLFKIDDRGVLTRVEDAKAFTYFNPLFADNDILITVEVAQDGYNIKNVLDWYQAKKANQHTIRGWGKRVRNQNQYIIAQEFEMALVPSNNVLRQVSPGPVSYGLV